MLSSVPAEGLAPLSLVHRDMAVKLDGVGEDEALDLPRVAKGQPVVWLLVLEAVHNALQRATRREGG